MMDSPEGRQIFPWYCHDTISAKKYCLDEPGPGPDSMCFARLGFFTDYLFTPLLL